MAAPARRSARISAWAVGSLVSTGEFRPRPITRSSSAITAPTGTSPAASASLARPSAIRIYSLSSTVLKDRQLHSNVPPRENALKQVHLSLARPQLRLRLLGDAIQTVTVADLVQPFPNQVGIFPA